MNRGLWTVFATAVAVGTGIVIGEQLRGQATAGPDQAGARGMPSFQLGDLNVPLAAAPPTGPSPDMLQAEVRISGTIQAINLENHTLVLASARLGASATVHVTADTRISHQVQIAATQLKPDDRIVVTGVPLQMDVRSIQQAPAGAGMTSGPGFGMPAPGGAGRGGGFPGST